MKIPLMMNIEGRALVLGGGNVGMHKVSQLSKFDVDIVLMDMDDIPVNDILAQNNIKANIEFIKAEVRPDNISSIIPNDISLVVSALEDRALNARVADYCNAKGILVNVVDDPELSSVFFTAFSKKGDIVISITTSGKCPFLARKMRERMDDSMKEWENWLKVLAPLRCDIDGIENKNRVLTEIYENDDIRELVKAGKVDEAKSLARLKCTREVSNVHS